jgi:hypothetical protein
MNLESIVRWGLRLVAGGIFLSGVIALVAALTPDAVHIHSIVRKQSAPTFRGVHAFGVALLLLGVGSATFCAVAPPSVHRNWWRISSFVVVAMGGLVLVAYVIVKVVA